MIQMKVAKIVYMKIFLMIFNKKDNSFLIIKNKKLQINH